MDGNYVTFVKFCHYEKVCFSGEEMQVELKLENWREKLQSENLANEESKLEGKVELIMYITVENVD